jgi:hypothetical protein
MILKFKVDLKNSFHVPSLIISPFLPPNPPRGVGGKKGKWYDMVYD